MTKQELRDHFAGQALQGIFANNINKRIGDKEIKICYQAADAMLAEREKHEHEFVDNYIAGMFGKTLGKSCTLCGKLKSTEE